MSEFQVRVVQLGEIRKHPGADNLSITEIGGAGGYPVILRTGEFQQGDRAVYIPVGALLPADDGRRTCGGSRRGRAPSRSTCAREWWCGRWSSGSMSASGG